MHALSRALHAVSVLSVLLHKLGPSRGRLAATRPGSHIDRRVAPAPNTATPPPPPPGTVDLTNCALVTTWSWTVTLVDMAWGSLACSVLALTQRTLCTCFPSLGL